MIIYFILVLVGSYVAARLIASELRKERRDYLVLNEPSTTTHETQESLLESQPLVVPIDKNHSDSEINFAEARFHKWEQIMAEKRLEVSKLLQTVQMQKQQISEFEKFKSLLERQIFESREMNRNLKRDIDDLMAQNLQSKQTVEKLQRELNYKNQLMNQAEIKMDELKNRIPKVVAEASSPIQDPSENEGLDLSEFSFDQLDWRKKIDD